MPPQEVAFFAPAVVSDINLPTTMDMIGREHFAAGFVEKIDKFNISDSVLEILVAVKNRTVLEKIHGDPEILLADSLDMNDNFRRIRMGELSFMDLNDFAQEDPGCCPEGHGVVALIAPVPMDIFSPIAEVREKQNADLAEKMFDRVEGYFPGFKDALDLSTLYIVDPYVAQTWMGTPKGTEMGFYPTVHNVNILWGVPMQDLKNVVTRQGGITGFFQVGQFSFPGGGQPTVSQSGQTAAMMIANGINMPRVRDVAV